MLVHIRWKALLHYKQLFGNGYLLLQSSSPIQEVSASIVMHEHSCNFAPKLRVSIRMQVIHIERRNTEKDGKAKKERKEGRNECLTWGYESISGEIFGTQSHSFPILLDFFDAADCSWFSLLTVVITGGVVPLASLHPCPHRIIIIAITLVDITLKWDKKYQL